MTSKSDAQFFQERGFGLTMGFGERPAILVVDLVKAFTDPTRMLGADLDSQITATQSLLEVAHDRGIP
ncbi:MAG: carbamoylsarcosine amidase, partial [Xanthobacteraceae bacterium]